jgi:predicted N-acetyltransferase YhbS
MENSMDVRFDKAGPADYDEVIDLANYVFSHDHRPHDFPSLLPKLYKREYFMDGIHYLAHENGRIKAAVGAYPLTMEFADGTKLPGRGIGMVSVHPYARGKGYMKTLMNNALDDMEKDGMVFSCLGGQRQRYEYWGYVPVGTKLHFQIDIANIKHCFKEETPGGMRLEKVAPGDVKLLKDIASLHAANPLRAARPEKKLFDILSSWKSEIYAAFREGTFRGYFIYKREENEISEIYFTQEEPLRSALLEAMKAFLTGGLGASPDALVVDCSPAETEKAGTLARFAEGYTSQAVYQIKIFDYPRFLAPLAELQSRLRRLTPGQCAFRVGEREEFSIAVENDGNTVVKQGASGGDPVALSEIEAPLFFLSGLAPLTFSAQRENLFLQSLFPLPFGFEEADGV